VATRIVGPNSIAESRPPAPAPATPTSPRKILKIRSDCSFFLEQFKLCVMMGSSRPARRDVRMPATAAASLPELVDNEHVALTPLEVEVIGLFVNAVKLLGMPKSVGEIYGMLFIAPEPLPLDALVERLNISKGSASQGLKVLRAVGAVKLVYVGGDRRDHYAAETELKQLAAGFIREEIRPRLESGAARLEHLKALAERENSARGDFLRNRVGKLSQWHARSQQVMPLISGMLD
jgi:DNA-binding transcriptional regulator GbsR (MarR family)